MKFYSIGHIEILDMPTKTFWMLSRNIDRINAEDDYREAVIIGLGMGGGEGYSKLLEDLREKMGLLVEYEPEVETVTDADGEVIVTNMREVQLDQEGLNSIKDLGRLG